MEAFDAESAVNYAKETGAIEAGRTGRSEKEGFGYYWMDKMKRSTENFGIRTYNVSRHMVLRGFGK